MEHFSPFQTDKKLEIKPRAVSSRGHGNESKTFMHVDLDAFFASVEQVKNPKLRGKPVIVGGRNSRRGVVAACSYEAKRCGITNGMPWQRARAKCPEAIFLAADFEAYAEYSDKVQRILEKMAPVVAQASVDESYLDMTGCERLYGSFRRAAERIFNAIGSQTGLNVSLGISSSQSIAKIGSKMAKPCGMMEIPDGSEIKFLSPLPVETMPGIGPRLGERLRQMGILTLGQLASFPADLLREVFGIYGPYLKSKASGEDRWELEITEVVKSIGKQRTLEENSGDRNLLKQKLFELIERVGAKLREKNLHARKIHVHVRYPDFQSDGGSLLLKDPTNFDRVLLNHAMDLFLPLLEKGPVRLIGFTAAELVSDKGQLDLFRTPKSERWERFYRSLDAARGHFGRDLFKIRMRH